ncbi:MAG: POTRA domain-containing protein, partial [Alcanivoracaceae bacterium]
MKTARTLMPLPVLLAGVMAFSGAWAAPAPDESPGVQLRELEQVDPDRYRAPRPLDFEVPDAPPMQAVPDAELTVERFQIVGNTAFDDNTLLALVNDFRGTITFSRLLEATAVVSNYYRSNGYIVAR